MNHKNILAAAALISALAALVGVLLNYNSKTTKAEPNSSASITGSGNIQQSGRGNTLNVSSPPKERETPECSLLLPDLDDYEDKSIKEAINSLKKANPTWESDLFGQGYIVKQNYFTFKDGEDFNDCISKYEGKIIKLDVWLGDKTVKEAENYQKANGHLRIDVPSQLALDFSNRYKSVYLRTIDGFEYGITISGDSSFIPAPRRLTTIKGLFKVSSIDGPFQGIMSASLEGVRIEDVH